MPSIEWLAPAPLWGAGTVDRRQPWLAELATDDFVPEFVGLMEGRFAPSRRPNDLIDLRPAPTDNALKLYQPLHGRYYLATGTLVCRMLGLPDRTVAAQNGERAAFVVRRSTTVGGAPQEQGWVNEGPNRGWQPLTDAKGRSVAVRADEERLPLHAITVCSGEPSGQTAAPPDLGCGRVVYYGYIPVASRAKYETPPPAASAPDPATALQSFTADVRASATPGSPDAKYDFRLDEIDSRVIDPLHRVLTATNPVDRLQGTAADKAPEFSLYLVVDLASFVSSYLPSVFQAVTAGAPLPAGSQLQALADALRLIKITKTPAGQAPVTGYALASAVADLKDRLGLASGVGDEPADQYDVRPITVPSGTPATYFETDPALPTPFKTLVQGALAEEPIPPRVGQDVIDLLRDQVQPAPATAGESQYFLRLVYEHAPCEPVVSAPSESFALARFMDPDAPARHIRLEMPSIKMKDLRKYKPGVGIQMPPDLRDLMGRVNKGMLTGGGLDPSSGGLELGMICSFSLQIIFLVAFIVMFIFLIALNFVFWWLPFLKICFPIPKRA